MTPEREDWLRRLASIRRWARGDQRAPHKPLLILSAIGKLQQTGSSRMRFATVHAEFSRLLADYGPARPSQRPEYPFFHLQSDGIWHLNLEHRIDLGIEPSSARLIRAGAVGELDSQFEEALRGSPQLMASAIRLLLETNFEDSLHEDICADCGIDLSALEGAMVAVRAAQQRDAHFRDLVLMAYEAQCAFCGFDGLLSGQAVGLDAAHVRWWAFGGPDRIENALCLCSLHHRLFDRGSITFDESLLIQVSQRFLGRSSVAKVLVLDCVGRPIRRPQSAYGSVGDDYIRWHNREVFQGPARIPAAEG